MSIRFHRGPKTLTLFHDARSPASERVLRLVQARMDADAGAGDEGAQSSSSANAAPPQQHMSPANTYLHKAATHIEREPAFLLDIVERKRATPDQWRTITSWLNQQKNPDNASSQKPPLQSQIEALKDEQGPMLVNWDDGQVITTEDDAKALLQRLESQRDATETGGGSWCVVM